MLRSLFARWLGSVAGLWAASHLFVGLSVAGVVPLSVAAVVLGAVNAVVRPVFVFFTFPITVVTLGGFLLVINAAMLGLTAFLVPGFEVQSFVSALLGSILVSLGTALGDWIGARGED